MGRWGDYIVNCANAHDKEVLLEEWEEVCNQVKLSGKDLSRVPITCTDKNLQRAWQRGEMK